MAARSIFVALIRGINVGRAKRIAMKDLRALIEGLGYTNPQTVLNSGNVIFTGTGKTSDMAATDIQYGIKTQLGVSARVMVVSAGELAVVVDENPLVEIAENMSRLLVSFPAKAADLRRLEPLATQDWGSEAIAIGKHAAYVWSPNGVLASRIMKAAGDVLGEDVTTRNWATVLKLHALATGRG